MTVSSIDNFLKKEYSSDMTFSYDSYLSTQSRF